MQQCRYGALILMSAHFTQGGRKPVNQDIFWRHYLHQHLLSAQMSSFDTRRRQSALITYEGVHWPLHIGNISRRSALKVETEQMQL